MFIHRSFSFSASHISNAKWESHPGVSIGVSYSTAGQKGDCFRRFISILLSKRPCFQFPGCFHALWTMRLIHRINASVLFLPHGRPLVICAERQAYKSPVCRGPKSAGDSWSVCEFKGLVISRREHVVTIVVLPSSITRRNGPRFGIVFFFCLKRPATRLKKKRQIEIGIMEGKLKSLHIRGNKWHVYYMRIENYYNASHIFFYSGIIVLFAIVIIFHSV